ncbi:MAG: UvrB/UvrC motif-containing protein [Patescibacteria group bacterium]|nr:UvrB/UvrC motif-containing protein [Patescibacteria group bacterium]
MKGFKFLNKKDVSLLPKRPGVYLFKAKKEILYIGKAGNIKERVKNHFQVPGFKDHLFLEEIEKIGFKKTESEIEALLLEANLIKKFQPKYNVLWKDDKNFFFVGITKEDFPRAFITHQTKKSETRNPKPEMPIPWSILDKVGTNSKFEIRNSKFREEIAVVGPFVDGKALKQTLKILRKVFPYRSCRTLPKRPCLWYQLERCQGVCKFKIQKSKVKTTSQKSKLKEFKNEYNRNIRSLVKILRGKETQVLKDLKREMKKYSESQEYEKAGKIRDQIIALENVFQHSRISQFLSEKRPFNWQKIEKNLREILKTKKRIKRLEAYDISNIQGKEATGAMVVFEKGKPNKSEYRKFRVKIAGKPNDVAMLKEVLNRRFEHPEWKFPDLILIDGGIAQLNVALKIKYQKSKIKNTNQKLKIKLKINQIKLMALAKKKNELYLENQRNSILLKNLPQEVANLILHLRDEAHRFAIKYHRKLRKKAFID